MNTWYLTVPGLGGACAIDGDPVDAPDARSAWAKLLPRIKSFKAISRQLGNALRPGDVAVMAKADAIQLGLVET